jgi:hypothetical protein
MRDPLIDRAAARLRATNRAFTRRNLFHAVRRAGGDCAAPETTFEAFVGGALAKRLRAGDIDGLLPSPKRPSRDRRSWRSEWDAYFPAAVLMVDSHEVRDLFIASGVLVHARLAVITTDGSPEQVVAWLQRGLRAGYRAPFGYLHEASTVIYPYLLEPFATVLDVHQGEAAPVVELGLPPDGLPMRAFGAAGAQRVLELEAVEPSILIAWAVRQLVALQPRDEWLRPLSPKKRRKP